MAEYVFRDLIEKRGLSSRFEIASAATSDEETGNPVYPPARRKLQEHGIDCSGKRARRIIPEDYSSYDLLIGMDQQNLRNMQRVLGPDPENKMRLLLSFSGSDRSIADPWYTDDYETAYRDILKGCRGLLRFLGID